MFEKILVANRGEIAVRVTRTCRELGIPVVAVFSDADRDGLHVRLADEAVHIGPAAAAESYLDIDRVIDAARARRADAIHPGYGFLAENPEFARRCREAGLVFIGPSPEAMALMGNKAEARRVAREVGVPTVPGSLAALDDADAPAEAERVGFPLLIKAAAGGGGRGMRLVRAREDLASALVQARSEAAASFGDGSVYLERHVERPRHVEFQIVGDLKGQVVHLLERECSIQRRHQKLVEECPSVRLSPELRREMGEAAVALARAGGYQNAGTVEFLIDPAGKFYFLEMNARLQVEHPVTEMVTGFDLVRLQIEVAAGHALPFRQEDVRAHGWAMEFRITAEDPYRDFLPSAGTLRLVRPAGGPGVRDDSGYDSGSTVSPFYDSLLSKLVVWGEDRPRCLARAKRALREYRVSGVPTSLPFFRRLALDPEFIAGDFDTSYVERRWSSALSQEIACPEGDRTKAALVAAAHAFFRLQGPRELRSVEPRSAWREAGLREQMRGRR